MWGSCQAPLALPSRPAVTWQLASALAAAQRRSQGIGGGARIRAASFVIHSATPRSPILRTAEPVVLGMQNGLVTTHDILTLPWHPTLSGEEP